MLHEVICYQRWLIKSKGALLRYGSQLVKFNCVLPPFGKLAKYFLSLASHTLNSQREEGSGYTELSPRNAVIDQGYVITIIGNKVSLY